jgi:hypothetical protein
MRDIYRPAFLPISRVGRHDVERNVHQGNFVRSHFIGNSLSVAGFGGERKFYKYYMRYIRLRISLSNKNPELTNTCVLIYLTLCSVQDFTCFCDSKKQNRLALRPHVSHTSSRYLSVQKSLFLGIDLSGRPKYLCCRKNIHILRRFSGGLTGFYTVYDNR